MGNWVMQLSRQQRLMLERYRTCQRAGGPSLGKLLLHSLNQYAVIAAAVTALLTWRALASDEATFIASGLLIGGMVVGVLARDSGHFASTVRAWPVFSEAIDWRRVDQLLDQPQ